MSRMTRRDFIEKALVMAAVPVVPAFAAANDRLRIAVAGVRGRGRKIAEAFAKMGDVEVVTICDVDENIVGPAMKAASDASGKKAAFVLDFRRVIEDKSIDAVAIATPNHTHALLSIWAAQAGKHVYVEKPLSHNVWEGRKVVEAARKYNVCIQHGTGNRSRDDLRRALAFVHKGGLGKVEIARGFCYKRRESIGKTPESPVPPGVDYDLWLGPAPLRVYSKNRFHYNWHWHWDYGNGDIGNEGVHHMDVARWALGKYELPRKILSIGGRFGYEDDGETANTQIAWFDYGDSQLLFEVRGLATEPYREVTIGCVIGCAEGSLSGTKLTKSDGTPTPLANPAGEGGSDHFRNFVDAVKSGKPQSLTADVQEGHLSSALCHLANISYRLGRLQPLAKNDPFGEIPDANEAFERMRHHLQANGVDLERTQLRVGRALTLDPKAETFVGDAEADAMLSREYRKPFVVPEKV